MAHRGRPPKSPVTETTAETAVVKRLQDYPRHERENADKVDGEALLELGHRCGLPRSSMLAMTAAKLRQQIKLAQTNSYEVA